MAEPLRDFERGVVAGKLVASKAFVEALDALPETLGISGRLRDVRARFAVAAGSLQTTLDDDDIARDGAGLPPYATALLNSPQRS